MGGEKELFSLEKKHDDHHDAGHDSHHDAGHDSHDAGHDSHGNGVHFHGATELQAGYQFKVGEKGVKVDLMGGGGVKTDFSHANPYVTAGSAFEKGNHKMGSMFNMVKVFLLPQTLHGRLPSEAKKTIR